MLFVKLMGAYCDPYSEIIRKKNNYIVGLSGKFFALIGGNLS